MCISKYVNVVFKIPKQVYYLSDSFQTGDTVVVWTGGYCNSNEDCFWQNSKREILYDFWLEDEPNVFPPAMNPNHNKLENKCVTFAMNDEEKHLATADCKEKRQFVCQRIED